MSEGIVIAGNRTVVTTSWFLQQCLRDSPTN